MVDNFILELDNFLTPEQCEHYIDYFEAMKENGFTNTRLNQNRKPHDVEDQEHFIHECVQYTSFRPGKILIDEFWENAYPKYAEKYSILLDSSEHNIDKLKIQKTEPGQGYHSWHYETLGKVNRDRLLFFIVYLNDIEEGGETEFLYLRKRIKAKQGKLIMAPAGFTHTHRGNPPLSETKYIMTGWVEYT